MTIKEMIKEFERQWNESSELSKEVVFDGGSVIATSYLIRGSTVDLFYEKNYIGHISLKNVIWVLKSLNTYFISKQKGVIDDN